MRNIKLGIFAALTCSLLVGAGCAGTDDPVLTDAQILSLYNFSMQTSPGGIGISVSSDNLNVTTTNFGGAYSTVTSEFALERGSQIDIRDLSTSFFGDLQIEVTEIIVIPPGGDPTEGEVEITSTDDSFDGTITVRVNPNVSPGVAGVDIEHDTNDDGTPEVTIMLPWSSFDDSGSPPQQIAEFAHSALMLLVDQLYIVVESFDLIDDNFDTLEAQGSIAEDCDVFPVGVTPPASVIMHPGSHMFSWGDAAANGGIGPGDEFFWDFADCYHEQTISQRDVIYNGSLNLTGYSETIVEGFLTRIGYELGGGGVVYNGFSISVVDVVAPQALIEDTVTFGGGFSVALFE